ncbi:GGDEF domain-containing protein [Quadrisphaera sp. DSM 44207]|uniref:GGDEF domain-containing protein n=1 Tax=Quadrisphaera sp. DSM 44207 TaxID=1881057 RepID=UPI000880D083|nr:GGDEF domain-containing protein [Quadrisphaera sp. DSM 44207]SDQ06806.1 diguanylate cyclase (GGDEF) domain-containing protein [Quadrisphaera sp. DSM 44207]
MSGEPSPGALRPPRAPLLRPPDGLLARLRWLFLAVALFFTAGALLQTVLASGRPPGLRAATVVLLLAVAGWWVRCYRRSRFPPAGLVLELAAIGLHVCSPDDTVRSVGLLYGAVTFRSLYGSSRQVAAYIALAIGAYLAGLVLAVHLGLEPDAALVLQGPLPGVPVLGVVVHLVAVVGGQVERAVGRERVLSRAGLAIALAEDPERARHEGLAAVAALLRGVDGARAQVVLDGDQHPPPGGSRLVLPLRTSEGTLGDLVVDSTAPLPGEVRGALEVLGAQVAMGMHRAALTADLRHRATHDPLTGLANRAPVEEALRRALSDPAREAALLLLDLDGFKGVNDVHGHAAGDALLIAVAGRLRSAVRSGDLVARLGGDEFVVLLAGEGAAPQAPMVAERLRRRISAPVRVGDVEVTVGVSIGVATAHPGTTPGALLREADEAMYRAKAARGERRRREASSGPQDRRTPRADTASLS